MDITWKVINKWESMRPTFPTATLVLRRATLSDADPDGLVGEPAGDDGTSRRLLVDPRVEGDVACWNVPDMLAR